VHSNGLADDEIDVMKDLLILNRQHEVYVRKLLSNLKCVRLKIENHVKNYGEKLLKLHDIVQYRSAVPSVQIFPKFKELSDEWLMLHNLSYVLSQLSQINNYLQHLSELCRQQQFDDVVHKLLAENQVETDHTRLQKRRELKLVLPSSTTAAPNVSIVQPPESNSEVNFSDFGGDDDAKSISIFYFLLQIDYLGFCTFILAESKILLPSVPDMGTVLWNQKIYGFYCVEIAELFMAKPAK